MTVERRFLPDIDRYHFDFGECSYEKGFAQIDTDQDAPWFGQWCSPSALLIVSYAEGDLTIRSCADSAEFAEALRALSRWEAEQGRSPARIDPGLQPAMREAFEALGLADLLH